MGETGAKVEPVGRMNAPVETMEARAVISTDGAVWNANESFCALVRLDESGLRHLGWRQLVHAADRRYVAAHLVEVLAGSAHLREFDVRLVRADGEDVPARMRVELVHDSEGHQGWFLVEAWPTT
jgi:PAS domain S-box-containing protein